MTRVEFMKYFKKDKMLDMMDLVIDSLKVQLTKMGMYEYFKEELGEGKKHDNFIMLQGTLDNLTSEIELDEGGEEVGNIIMKNYYSYWLSDLLMKQRRLSGDVFTYANICKDELSKYMDFYKILKLIQNLDEDKESLLKFLKENYNEEIKDDIDYIKALVNYQNTYADAIKYVTGNLHYLVYQEV